MKWINAKEKLPPVNEQDKLDTHHRISIDVLTYSKWGVRVGRYYHYTGLWLLDGVYANNRVKVDHWMKIELPKTSDND